MWAVDHANRLQYIRVAHEHEAAKEELLAELAEEYHRPGYLGDEEWRRLNGLFNVGDTDHARMQLEIAIYRKAAAETWRVPEFDDDGPAEKRGSHPGGPSR